MGFVDHVEWLETGEAQLEIWIPGNSKQILTGFVGIVVSEDDIVAAAPQGHSVFVSGPQVTLSQGARGF